MIETVFEIIYSLGTLPTYLRDHNFLNVIS